MNALIRGAQLDDILTIDTILSEQNIHVNTKHVDIGRTALMIASAWNALHAVELLLRRGADPNIVDPDGQTALHLAAENNSDATLIKALIDAGANVNASDLDGYTPLHIAAMEGHVPTTKTLLLSGADLSRITSKDSKTALDLSMDEKQRDVTLLLQGWNPKWSLKIQDALAEGWSMDAIEQWTVEDVANFIRKLGLPLYVPNFIAQEIDGQKLLELREAELEKTLDIANGVHRVQILQTIADLRLALMKSQYTEKVVVKGRSPTKLKALPKDKLQLDVLHASNRRNEMLVKKPKRKKK